VSDEELIRRVDDLEGGADGYLTLEEVQAGVGGDVSRAIEEHVLLVDYRTSVDGAPVTLCRLNRRHPLVQQITKW
jgi:hypothetical protein